jgi:hypothetical protein
MSIYIALYMVTLFAASVRGDPAYITGLWMIFVASLFSWVAPSPLLWLASAHFTTASYFILVSECKKCTISAGLMAFGALACSLAYFLGFGAARPVPDILALLGHLANLCAFLRGGSGGRLDRVFRLRGLDGRGDNYFVSLFPKTLEAER